MEHQTLQDWACDEARLAGVSPMVADSSGETVIVGAEDGAIYTPTLMSEERALLLQRAELTATIAAELTDCLSTWATPSWLGSCLAYVLYEAITGGKFMILPDCDEHDRFHRLLSASFKPGCSVWKVIEDKRPAAAEPRLYEPERILAFMLASRVYSGSINQLVTSLAAQNATKEDVRQLLDPSVIYDAIEEVTRGLGNHSALVPAVKDLLVEHIKTQMP